jgi:hypothetical protein
MTFYGDYTNYGLEKIWTNYTNENGYTEYLVLDDVQTFNNPVIAPANDATTTANYFLGMNFQKGGMTDSSVFNTAQTSKLCKT